jgi:hypothetical protein
MRKLKTDYVSATRNITELLPCKLYCIVTHQIALKVQKVPVARKGLMGMLVGSSWCIQVLKFLRYS